ncbi:hypothetical protein V2J09_022295 [Rumex salicifolius]
MQRIFGVKKQKDPPPSIGDATDRISKRGENVDEKIKRLDGELARYKEQIKKTRPGPAQEAVKARAMRVLKQKRMYEGQRDMLYNQTFNLDQVSFAAEGIKDAQETMSALKAANKDLKGMMKTVKINEIDNLQDEMMDLMDMSSEIQETLGRSYNVPDDIDEDELMGELDGLEFDMESESQGVPSYLQPDKDSDLESEISLPSAPTRPAAVPAGRNSAQVSRIATSSPSTLMFTSNKRQPNGASIGDKQPANRFKWSLMVHQRGRQSPCSAMEHEAEVGIVESL